MILTIYWFTEYENMNKVVLHKSIYKCVINSNKTLKTTWGLFVLFPTFAQRVKDLIQPNLTRATVWTQDKGCTKGKRYTKICDMYTVIYKPF